MLRLNKLLIIVLLIIPFYASPQLITSVNFSGNKIFGSSELKAWSSAPGSKYFPSVVDSIKAHIFAQMGREGYFNPSFTRTNIIFSDDSSSVEINISLDEGPPTYISSVLLTGDSILTPGLISGFKFLEGSVFSKSEIEQNISAVLSFLENSGYPFGRVIIKSLYFFTDSSSGTHNVDVTFAIDKEISSTIDKIVIEGNSSTKDYVIVRELRFEPGEKYSQKKIEQLPERLNKLRFFEPVSVPQFYINSSNQGVLQINVKEKQTNNFDGIIGYIPGTTEGEKGFLTGLVNISLRNLFGTGRGAAIRWQQLDRNSQELELRYFEPWLFGFPFNLSGGLLQRKQDSTYIQRNFEGALEFLATENISASVSLSSEQVTPVERVNSVFTVYNSSMITTGLNLTIDTRDDPYAPSAGIYFINSYSFTRKKINGPPEFIFPGFETNVNLQRLALDISGYFSPFSRQVAALGLHGRELRGSFFEISDLYRLGGTNTLRGFREDQFLGSRIFWSNLEYRFALTRRSFVFAFFDTGYFLRSAEPDRDIPKQEAFKTSYGLGLNIETGLGILSVSYALAQGNSFANGLIHFGIVNEF